MNISYRPYNDQRVERWHKQKENAAIRRGKVVCFLRNNPLSTSEEIFAATGSGPMAAQKFVKYTRRDGKVVWRLNHQKLREEGLE